LGTLTCETLVLDLKEKRSLNIKHLIYTVNKYSRTTLRQAVYCVFLKFKLTTNIASHFNINITFVTPWPSPRVVYYPVWQLPETEGTMLMFRMLSHIL
jgi:hypothetical protein